MASASFRSSPPPPTPPSSWWRRLPAPTPSGPWASTPARSATPPLRLPAPAQRGGARGGATGPYRDRRAAPAPHPATPTPTANGPVPAYLSNQIANYQAGLNRLLSGGDSSGGLFG